MAEEVSVRDTYGMTLAEIGKENRNIVVLDADLRSSTMTGYFMKEFPQRFFEIGIAEQNMISVASGLAAMGKTPFAISYAIFSPGRNWEQIRTTVCINQQNVKIVGSHAGLSAARDGATHQILEDIALMRSLPGMLVIAPADSTEAYQATLAIAEYHGPAYLRLSREETPLLFSEQATFSLHKALLVRAGRDVTLLSTGTMLYQTLIAAHQLAHEGVDVEVWHVPVIKPLDEKSILASITRTGAALTIEEGQVAAGFGSAICELVSQHHPSPVRRLGVKDRYGQSGDSSELLAEYDLTAHDIYQAALRLVQDLGRSGKER